MRDMFKFVHAWQPGDSWEPLAANGFVGVETAKPVDGAAPLDPEVPVDVPVTLLKSFDADFASGGRLSMVVKEDLATTFTLYADQPDESPVRLGAILRDYTAKVSEASTAMIANTPTFTSAKRLWDVVEAAYHPRVKVALDLDVASAAGERAAVVVPTLNLRIGQVRVGRVDAELADYARRLAGIGYEGYVVTDPPAGPARAAASIAIAAAFRDVLPPVKPVKKVPPKATK